MALWGAIPAAGADPEAPPTPPREGPPPTPPPSGPPLVYAPPPPVPAYFPPYYFPPYGPPPPLPIGMRVVYAPFYVTGLVLHYAVYYVIVAPLEVLDRTLTYGVDGGVEREDRDER